MPRSRRKQLEIEKREADFLRIARRLFLANGMQGLTMDKLAAQTPYSKGTIYQHFASKEDVLAALCLESGRLRFGLLERAAMFRGRSRERAIALAKADYIFFELNPDYWRTEQISNVLSLGFRVSPERRAALDALFEAGAGIALGIIRDAIVAGDLALEPPLTPEKVFLSLLGTTRGLYLYCSGNPLFCKWAGELWSTHEQLFGSACDGFGWRPLSKDWDYADTVNRIWREIFPAETAKLGLESRQQPAHIHDPPNYDEPAPARRRRATRLRR